MAPRIDCRGDVTLNSPPRSESPEAESNMALREISLERVLAAISTACSLITNGATVGLRRSAAGAARTCERNYIANAHLLELRQICSILGLSLLEFVRKFEKELSVLDS